ncbi:RNA polymerase sigma factor [Flavobacterium limi]|uniref:DNA-binding protein n=1 Tax=Flavobacterium limi TaxID=2045105 RepID=A0ABQ1TT22_9FLAO|nr:sigma-70 family RNA polymerase sigma factor [Flavobacterium limi]GGF00634.1 DNA-binding protein [Flavobacterium limi]
MSKKEIYNTCSENHFSLFFKNHEKALRNFLYYKFGNEEQAYDTAQEAFIKLWQNCSSVPWEKAKSYLYTVAFNKSLKVVAHQKVVLNYVQESQPVTATNESPEFVLEEEQFRQKLLKAIDDLNETQKVAFLMHRIDKIPQKEIAATLGISVKAVEKRLHLAMLALKKNIENFR